MEIKKIGENKGGGFNRGADQWLAKNFPYLFGGSVGGGAPADPFAVLNELSLTAISDELDGKYYTVKAKYWSGAIDISTAIDQSHARELGATLWASDWSVNNDGWALIDGGGTLTFGITQAGKINCMKLTAANIGVDRHRFREAILVSGKTYYLTLKTYCPSTNSVWDGHKLEDPTTAQWDALRYSTYDNPVNLDAWNNDAIHFMAEGPNLDLLPYDATGSSPAPNGDEMYFKDLIVREVAGNHFGQFTNSGMPHRNITDNTFDFDGIAQVLEDKSGTFAAAVKDDTAGMFTMFIRDDDITGQSNNMYLFGDNSNRMWLSFEQVSGPKQVLQIGRIVAPGGGDYLLTTVDLVAERAAQWMAIQWGSDGSEYFIYVNGVRIPITSGTNNGNWLDSFAVSLTEVKIGNAGSGYMAMGLRHFGYISGRVLTADEITAINSTSTYTAP